MPIRGLKEGACDKCHLVLDDVASANGFHFPCIIYLREGGKSIGKMDETFREQRVRWHNEHEILKDPICSSNCLDVCQMFNNFAGLNRR